MTVEENLKTQIVLKDQEISDLSQEIQNLKLQISESPMGQKVEEQRALNV